MKKSTFKNGMLAVAGTMVATFFAVSPVNSAILSATNGGEVLGAAPTTVEDDTTTNDHQQGFDELQGYTLLSDLSVSGGGTISTGTRVDSHMIFLNSQGNANVNHFGVEWTFSGAVLGVMADIHGTLEAASNFLGAVGTTYPGGFDNRGLEGTAGGVSGSGGGDVYSFLAGSNALTVGMHVTEPGDWIRVITVSAVPLPAALPLYGAGIAVLGFMGWRRRKNAA